MPEDPHTAAIDTNVLAYAQRTGELAKRSRWLLAHLELENITVIIPTVVLGEYLQVVEDTESRARITETLGKQFAFAPYDVKSAITAAGLTKKYSDRSPDASGAERRVIKADAQIVSSAKSIGASTFYSHDKRCRSMAADIGLKPYDLPEIPNDLFGYSENK